MAADAGTVEGFQPSHPNVLADSPPYTSESFYAHGARKECNRADTAYVRMRAERDRILELLREEGGITFGCWCPGILDGTDHDPGCSGPRVIYGPKTQALLAQYESKEPT